MASKKTRARASSDQTRRRLLRIAGGSTLGIALGGCASSHDDGPDADDENTLTGVGDPPNDSGTGGPTPDCVLTPEAIEGPFYKDLNLIRQDIVDDRQGEPLTLRFKVVDSSTCEPIPNAIVDIWHADAGGLYSAFPGQGDEENIDTSSSSFLRGIQTTDGEGTASFMTIYPGWYQGRTTHLHVKVLFDNRTQVTTQLFFPDDTTASVYQLPLYVARGAKDTTNAADDFGGPQAPLRMTVSREGDRYLAVHTLGIERS